jgi:hypothetical protein
MPTARLPGPEDCNCFAVRSAARHVTQLSDQFLAPIGLRVTQFSVLAKLKRKGPLTINALADPDGRSRRSKFQPDGAIGYSRAGQLCAQRSAHRLARSTGDAGARCTGQKDF